MEGAIGSSILDEAQARGDGLSEPEHIEVEVLINGEPWERVERMCSHESEVLQQVTYGKIPASDDPGAPIIRRQILIKLRCAECGEPFTIDPSTAESRDDGRAIVFDVKPEH